MKHKENADQCAEALKSMSYKSHVVVTHYWCDDKTCLTHSHYCLLYNDIHEVLDFNVIYAWSVIMFKNKATVHASSISIKTRSADQSKKRTSTTFISSIVTPSSLSSMFNMSTSSSIQIYTTFLTASSTLILLHHFSDL